MTDSWAADHEHYVAVTQPERARLAERLQWLAGQVQAGRPVHAELDIDRSSIELGAESESAPVARHPLAITYTVTVALPVT